MFIRIALSLAFTLTATLTAVRADDAFDPATVMPADTFLYACFDVNTLQRGAETLDIVRVMRSPDYKDFLAPLLAETPIDEFLEFAQITEWVNGVAAVGLSAIRIKLRGFDGKYTTLRLAPGKPVDPKLFNLLWRAALTGDGPAVIFELEGVMVIDPGEKLRAWLGDILANPPVPLTHKIVQQGTHQILSITLEPILQNGIGMAPEFHIDIGADRWIVATSAVLLAEATAKERRNSLREDKRFVAARARHISGERVFFAYVDGAKVLSLARPFLPPVVMNAMAINGLESIENIALGFSIVDGGFRESFGVGLSENPKGFWRLLDAFPAGLQSVHRSSPRAVGHVAAKVDLALLDKRLNEVFGELLPGFETQLRTDLAQLVASLGIDYDTELLPALGDEIAMSFFLAGGPLAEMSLVAKLRDEPAFRALFSKIRILLAREDINFHAYVFEDDAEGWQGFVPFRVQLRIHDKHLLGATSAASLRRMIASWAESEKTLARDGEVFRKVMQGMNGGTTDDLALLVYADIRKWMPMMLQLGVATGALEGAPFNTKKLPNFQKLGAEFSGVAVGLRVDKAGVAVDNFSPIGGIVALTMMQMLLVTEVMVADARAEPQRR